VLRFDVGPYRLNCSIVFQAILDLLGHCEMERFVADTELWIARPPYLAIRSDNLTFEWERVAIRPPVFREGQCVSKIEPKLP
jgi:hypothetical protein